MFCAYPWTRYRVSIYRTIGPLVSFFHRFLAQLNQLSSSETLIYGTTFPGSTKIEPRCEKMGLRGSRPGLTQKGLCNH